MSYIEHINFILGATKTNIMLGVHFYVMPQ